MDPDISTGYGWSPEVQRKALALPIFDRQAYSELGSDVFNAKHFRHPPLKPIAEELFKACDQAGGIPPSPELLRELVIDRCTLLKPETAETVRAELDLVLTANLSDIRLVKSKVGDWARVEALSQAVVKAAELLERGAVQNGSGERLLRLFEDALTVGKNAAREIRLIRDMDKALALLMQTQPRVPTGIPALDRALGGGAEPGLYVIAGDPKMGKTSFLTQIGVGSVRKSETIYYFSGEVTEIPMIRRTVAAMTGREIQEIRSSPQAAFKVLKAYKQTRAEFILDYSPSFSVPYMAAKIRKAESSGLRIGVVIADYIDLMHSTEHYNDRRFELSSVSKALRDLGVEMGVPIWSAKGVNRAAVNKPIVTKADLSECFDVAYVADGIFALCATEDERRRFIMRGAEKVKAPITRLFYAAGRESEDEYLITAFERDNRRQQWVEMPGYLDEFEKREAAKKEKK